MSIAFTIGNSGYFRKPKIGWEFPALKEPEARKRQIKKSGLDSITAVLINILSIWEGCNRFDDKFFNVNGMSCLLGGEVFQCIIKLIRIVV